MFNEQQKNQNNDSDISDDDFGDIDENIVHEVKKENNVNATS